MSASLLGHGEWIMASTSRGEWLDDFFAGFMAYYLTSLPVFVGILFGVDFPRPVGESFIPRPDLVSACVHFDAIHYVEIMREGYSYDPRRRSMVAFFPRFRCLVAGSAKPRGFAPERQHYWWLTSLS